MITEPFHRVSSQRALRGVAARLLAAAVASGVLAMAAPSAAPAVTGIAAPAAGRIEGVVRLMAPGEAPIASGAYPTRRVTRPASHPASEIDHVIVFVKLERDDPRAAALPVNRLRIVQKDEGFTPRVAAITRGSTVEFPNADPFFHNVFSLSRGASFDLGRFRRGESRARTFTRPGLIKVYCHLHSHMSASIMVFDHPHFTMPGADGAFTLEDVPAGERRISAWHERIGESAKSVTVEAGRTARIEFALPVESR